MTDQHLITPPPELVQQWLGTYFGTTVTGEVSGVELALATQAARWGWDQRGTANEAKLQKARDEELEACCEWVSIQLNCTDQEHLVPHFRAARRPKPPSLKEQALKALEQLLRDPEAGCFAAAPDTIRRALETLDD
jgi:hypothetical protein